MIFDRLFQGGEKKRKLNLVPVRARTFRAGGDDDFSTFNLETVQRLAKDGDTAKLGRTLNRIVADWAHFHIRYDGLDGSGLKEDPDRVQQLASLAQSNLIKFKEAVSMDKKIVVINEILQYLGSPLTYRELEGTTLENRNMTVAAAL